jgi:hypothetical protein
MSTLPCWLFGHKFVKGDFTGTFYWPGYCIRCGKAPEGDRDTDISRCSARQDEVLRRAVEGMEGERDT